MQKGYPSQEKDDRLKSEFPTVEPIRELQQGLSVLAHQFVREVGTDAVEAASTTSVINATAHTALKGDVIRFTSGTLSGREAKVWSVTTNTITLAETLSSVPATAVTFQILRHKYPLVGSDGTIPVSATLAAAPIQFVLDGVDTEVEEDTGTPSNSRPLPVKLMGTSGDINITAGDLNVQLTHAGGDYDSTRIGDGTTLLGITVSNEAKVLESNSGSIKTAVESVDTKVPANLTVTATRLLVDGSGVTQPVSAASLPLPSGAATEVKQDAGNTSLSSIDGKVPANLTVTSTRLLVDGSGVTHPVSASSLPLPSGASTEATLSTLEGKIPASLTVTSTRLLVDGSGVTQPVSGTVTTARLDVVDFIDGTNAILDTSSTNIPGSASNPVTLVASLASNVKAIQTLDTTGGYVGIYTGVALSEVLQAVMGPGSDTTVEVVMASGERVSAKRLDSTTALSSGFLAINFLG